MNWRLYTDATATAAAYEAALARIFGTGADEARDGDAAVVLQALSDTYRNLGGQPFMRRVDRGTYHRRESRVDELLPADDHEHPRAPGITR